MKLTTHFDFSELVDLLFLGFQYMLIVGEELTMVQLLVHSKLRHRKVRSGDKKKRGFFRVSVISLKMALGGILGRQCSISVHKLRRILFVNESPTL